MSDYSQTPGLYTDMINPFEENSLNWPFLYSKGFEWVTFQTYNPQLGITEKDFDLAAVKAHGFKNVGVWGVVYTQSDFYNCGLKVGKQAVKLGGQHVKIDAEECYKNTKVNGRGSEIIKGCRDGGWKGPVDLSTLGTPDSPLINDYAFDVASFLNTGGSIDPQAYINDYPGYALDLCKLYWETKVVVRPERLNYTLGLYYGKLGKVTGKQWVTMLRAAKIGKNFSVYLAQNGTKEDYDALGDYIMSQVTPTGPTSQDTRTKMITLADAWLKEQVGQQPLSRIRLARRILGSSDTQAADFKSAVSKVLNDSGVSQ